MNVETLTEIPQETIKGDEYLRLGQTFIDNAKITLKEIKCFTDSDKIIINQHGEFTFYHYTHKDKVSLIMAEGSGLWARRKVACTNPPQELMDCFLIEGFLSPLPTWLSKSEYYGDLGIKLTNKYIGNVLLEVTIPLNNYFIYIGDYSHILECKLTDGNETLGIGFDYDCSNGLECTQAYVNSYLHINEYKDQHHAPIVQVVRKGEGIVVPSHFIKVSAEQPRKYLNERDDIS